MNEEEILREYKGRNKHSLNSACYAPHTSLYFGHEGIVLPCCQNKTYVLGNYPEQSIQQIWEGAKKQSLKEALDQYDFGLGCQGCLTQLDCGNTSAMKAQPYDLLPLDQDGWPTELQFELINTCNLECIMCNGNFSSLIRTKREGKPAIKPIYDKAFVQQLIPFLPNLTQAQFYGGEPFLIEIYYDIWEAIIAHNPSVNIRIQTNGTILNSRLKDMLEASRFSINVSIDAPDKISYESIRRNGDFDTVIENTRWFSAYCRRKQTDFGISTCAMQQNLHLLPQMVQLSNDLNAKLYIHPLITPYLMSVRTLDQTALMEAYTSLSHERALLPIRSSLEQGNAGILHQYIQELKSYIDSADRQPDLKPSDINDLHDFARLLEPALLKYMDKATVYSCLEKFKEATRGLEFNPEVIAKFRHYNLSVESNLREFAAAATSATASHLRYLITEVMH